MRSVLLSLAVLAGVSGAHAQTYVMGTALVQSCTGTLYDTGGAEDEYANDETSTTVVCPDAPGLRTMLVFDVFQLNATPINQVPGDRLAIYDGATADAPFIGMYYTSQLAGDTVRASDANASGCLYLRFLSNYTGVGNYAATIGCEPGCSAPTAAFTTMGDTLVACAGATVELDASASEVPGGIGSWSWWVNGQLASSMGEWPVSAVSLPVGNTFEVRLRVVDALGCGSALSEAAWVWVSPAANFNGTPSPATTCPLDTVFLEGQATLSPWVLVQPDGGDYGAGALLPDDVGRPIDFHTTVDWYPEGATVASAEDLGSICLTMEHAHSGDLVIDLICPSGQRATLHQMQSGRTLLGDAYRDLPPDVPGTCWTYCFSSTASLGTWADHRVLGPDPNTVPVTYGDALLPDTYSPYEELDALVGCPVNGTWTLQLLDLWGADNGYLCSWELGFDARVDSSTVASTPQLNVQQPGSAFWIGNNVWAGATPDLANAFLLGGNEQAYTFVVFDDSGCAHDTTVRVTPLPRPVVDAGLDLFTCNGDANMAGAVQWTGADSCTFHLVLRSANGGGWTSASLEVVIDDVSIGSFATPFPGWFDTLHVTLAHGATIALDYTASPVAGWNVFNSFTLYDRDWAVVYASGDGPPTGVAYTGTASCAGAGSPATLAWTPATGLVDPLDPNSGLLPDASGWYTLTATNVAQCSTSDSLFVEAAFVSTALSYDSEQDLLCAEPIDGGTYVWYLDGEVQEATGPCIEVPDFGGWQVLVEVDSGCDLLSGVLPVCPQLVLIQSGGELQTTPDLGRYIWTFNGDTVQDGPSAAFALQGNGFYQVELILDGGGCVVFAEQQVVGTGVAEQAAPGNVRVVPNPNRGAFSVWSPGVEGRMDLTVLDLSGRAVLKRTLAMTNGRSGELVLDLAAGSYVLEVVTATERSRATVVVE